MRALSARSGAWPCTRSAARCRFRSECSCAPTTSSRFVGRENLPRWRIVRDGRAITRAISTRCVCSRACRCDADAPRLSRGRRRLFLLRVRSANCVLRNRHQWAAVRSRSPGRSQPRGVPSNCSQSADKDSDYVSGRAREASSGALGRFRSGIARLVAGTSTPVVPCHLAGAYEAWPKGHAPAVSTRVSGSASAGLVRFPDVAPGDPEAVTAISAQLRDDVAALAR